MKEKFDAENDLEEWMQECLIYQEILSYESLIRKLKDKKQTKKLLKIIKELQKK